MRSNTGWAKMFSVDEWHYFIKGWALCGRFFTSRFVPKVPALADRCTHCERKRKDRSENDGDTIDATDGA